MSKYQKYIEMEWANQFNEDIGETIRKGGQFIILPRASGMFYLGPGGK